MQIESVDPKKMFQEKEAREQRSKRGAAMRIVERVTTHGDEAVLDRNCYAKATSKEATVNSTKQD